MCKPQMSSDVLVLLIVCSYVWVRAGGRTTDCIKAADETCQLPEAKVYTSPDQFVRMCCWLCAARYAVVLLVILQLLINVSAVLRLVTCYLVTR